MVRFITGVDVSKSLWLFNIYLLIIGRAQKGHNSSTQDVFKRLSISLGLRHRERENQDFKKYKRIK